MEQSGEPSAIIVLGGNVGQRFNHFGASTILDKQEKHLAKPLSGNFGYLEFRYVCHTHTHIQWLILSFAWM